MKFFLPILFASIAAAGNALFAFGQKQSSGVSNGLLYVGASAFIACLLALSASPAVGPANIESIRQNWAFVAISGVGLFLTYLGFNLLYSNFGVSQYVLYAVISIVTTTVVVGFLVLKEPVNGYHAAAIVAALVTVVLFSIGQSKA
jgi:drug/metabolite transporter (DMT)-like permease